MDKFSYKVSAQHKEVTVTITTEARESTTIRYLRESVLHS